MALKVLKKIYICSVHLIEIHLLEKENLKNNAYIEFRNLFFSFPPGPVFSDLKMQLLVATISVCCNIMVVSVSCANRGFGAIYGDRNILII